MKYQILFSGKNKETYDQVVICWILPESGKGKRFCLKSHELTEKNKQQRRLTCKINFKNNQNKTCKKYCKISHNMDTGDALESEGNDKVMII